MVELAAVAGKFSAGIEHLAESILHHGDVETDAKPAAQLLLQVGRGRQVVGMHMGFDDPLDSQALLAHEGDDRVGRMSGGAARGGVEIEHRVDDGAGFRRRVRSEEHTSELTALMCLSYAVFCL